ncbi:hypothetical protein ABW19_dt0208975 [Dactylella cylindrospora]|nr:hypothetical protein ABW19_dt0208975 [Dactylella cylindrospora]
MDQTENGRAHKSPLQQEQHTISAAAVPSSLHNGAKQKLQLRTNQSLQDQLARLYQHHQQQNTPSPYVDFQNVLYSQGLGNNIANNVHLMNPYSPVSPMNGFPSQAPYLNNVQGAGGRPRQRMGSLHSPDMRSSFKSPIEAVGNARPVRRQSSTLDPLANSPIAHPGIGMDLSQVPSKSHSSLQSEFQTQPTHQTPKQTRREASQTQNNFEKRRDSLTSLPLHLDMDMQIDSGSLVPGVGGSGGSSNSTLTEFTKRRNWSQRIIEELQDLLCILTPSGKIRYSSPNTKSLTGYATEEILGRMITDFVHPDDSHIFIRDFNESIASNQQLRLFFRFRRKDGSNAIFEAHGHPHFSDQRQMPSNTTTPVCSGFFMMARLYPTKNTALLDSFLEHKIENERLKRRISELRLEEREDQQAQLRARSEAMSKETPVDARQNTSKSMPPPAMPGQLTRQNLEGLNNAALRSDSLRDKMARYEGVTHADTIEMLTGLRYTEGERSRGISTGDTSPSLIRGDVGVPMSADRESRGSGERKKKIKVTNEYVCTDCGTLDSPEWRKGPTGPKTYVLCIHS